MVDFKYARAYIEVLEILKYVPIEDYNKIPKEQIKLFKKYATTDSTFIYNPSKTLDENKVSKITKGIIAILYRNYWATDEQRKKIITWQNLERQRIENKKRELYNPDNIFRNQDKNIDIVENNQELSLTKTDNIKWYKKICKLIKNFFRI